MNESLRRALTVAGLDAEGVAARLGVDPKTVRRWLEGRLPFPRHRWELTSMLCVDDDDLWPELRSRRGRPEEVVGVYPRCADLPSDTWVGLLQSAVRHVRVATGVSSFLAWQFGLRGVLLQRAEADVDVRVCLDVADDQLTAGREVPATADQVQESGYLAALVGGGVQVRLQRGRQYERMVLADDELLVVERAWAVPVTDSPVIRLQRCGDSGLFAMHADSFDRVWADARPL